MVAGTSRICYAIGKIKQGARAVGGFIRYGGKKPQTLGEGLQRVVRAAGGKKGKLVSIERGAPKEVKGPLEANTMWHAQTDSGIVTRKYSNGVELNYGNLSTAAYGEHTYGFYMPHLGKGALCVNGADGSMYAAQTSTKSMFGRFCQRFIGTPINSCEASFAKDTEQAFKMLKA